MSGKKFSWKRSLTILMVTIIAYSFLPLIPFWFMEPASNGDNNQANVKKVENNEGAYFSFFVDSVYMRITLIDISCYFPLFRHTGFFESFSQ